MDWIGSLDWIGFSFMNPIKIKLDDGFDILDLTKTQSNQHIIKLLIKKS